ncbi:MAG: bacillithiol biosynthesis cysteine-adding enzyme BshC [Flavobacteriales bacterium]|jgi:bacillithiol biosynthesis cysteine-adding enzyme BshC
MRWNHIPYIESKSSSDVFKRLLTQDSSLKPFINHYPTLQGIRTYAEERPFEAEKRSVLVASLTHQNKGLASPESMSNIAKLGLGNTYSVTTGHQLGIFSGPAFFIYKIAHTIGLSKAMNEQIPGKTFVPVYWMASEDHDLAEINHFSAFKESFHWEAKEQGAVGRMSTDALSDVLEEWAKVMRWDETNTRYLLFKEYTEQRNLSEATRFLVNELFGDEGVIVLDADDQKLKQMFTSCMTKEVTQGIGKTATEGMSSLLKANGLIEQISARDINLFYLADNARLRLTHEQGMITAVGTNLEWTIEALLLELSAYPERFSPNVVLRPVYQEVILPNLIYVGGPGELAYWLQLKGVFDQFEVPYPVLMPRNGATILAGHQVKKLTKLNVELVDLQTREEDLIAMWVQKNASVSTSLDDAKNQTKALFDEVLLKLQLVDPTLRGKGEGVLAKQMKELERLEKAMDRALKVKNDTSINQLIQLKATLFPNGNPQEREQNFFALESAVEENLIQKLIEQFPAFEPGMLVVS